MTLPSLLLCNAAVIAVAMISLWLVSLRLRDASVVDIFWGLGFVVIAWVTLALSDSSLRAILLVACTTLWGLRLAGYLAWRNHGKGEDPRYAAMRRAHGGSFWWVSFFTVFVLQGTVMLVVALPVMSGMTLADVPLAPLNWGGVVVWCIGFLFEAIGDLQLARFKANAENSGKILNSGLWRYTRHPNYFGNAMIWWGLAVIASSTTNLWIYVSPVIMTFLLLKVSGVALLERSMKSRGAAYEEYIARTSAFVPMPPKKLTP